MKKRKLKLYLLVLGLLLIPCNVFAAKNDNPNYTEPTTTDVPTNPGTGTGSGYSGWHLASTSGNALSNSQGGPYTAAMLAAQADAPAGVTMFSNGHVMVNPFQIGAWFVEGQPSTAHNIFDHGLVAYT